MDELDVEGDIKQKTAMEMTLVKFGSQAYDKELVVPRLYIHISILQSKELT